MSTDGNHAQREEYHKMPNQDFEEDISSDDEEFLDGAGFVEDDELEDVDSEFDESDDGDDSEEEF